MDMPSMAGHNVTESDFVISVRGKQFILARDAELVVGIGDHQFMLSFDYDAQTVYLTDPNTKERLKLQVKDAIINGSSISQKLGVIDKIKKIVDVGTTGLILVDEAARVTTVEEFRLHRDNLWNNTEYEITGLAEGDLIYRMDIQVIDAFKTNPNKQHNIKVYDEDNRIVLMPETWSDPNVVGCYSTSLNYTIGPKRKLYVRHNLRGMTEGVAALRLYCAKPVESGG